MSAGQPFPWQAAMRFGLGVLGLPPDAFWAMTPRELAAAMRGRGIGNGPQPPDRALLEKLMDDHPDSPAPTTRILNHGR